MRSAAILLGLVGISVGVDGLMSQPERAHSASISQGLGIDNIEVPRHYIPTRKNTPSKRMKSIRAALDATSTAFVYVKTAYTTSISFVPAVATTTVMLSSTPAVVDDLDVPLDPSTPSISIAIPTVQVPTTIPQIVPTTITAISISTVTALPTPQAIATVTVVSPSYITRTIYVGTSLANVRVAGPTTTILRTITSGTFTTTDYFMVTRTAISISTQQVQAPLVTITIPASPVTRTVYATTIHTTTSVSTLQVQAPPSTVTGPPSTFTTTVPVTVTVSVPGPRTTVERQNFWTEYVTVTAMADQPLSQYWKRADATALSRSMGERWL